MANRSFIGGPKMRGEAYILVVRYLPSVVKTKNHHASYLRGSAQQQGKKIRCHETPAEFFQRSTMFILNEPQRNKQCGGNAARIRVVQAKTDPCLRHAKADPTRAMRGGTGLQPPPAHQLVLHADVHLPPALWFRPAVDRERHLRLVRGVEAPAKHADLFAPSVRTGASQHAHKGGHQQKDQARATGRNAHTKISATFLH